MLAFWSVVKESERRTAKCVRERGEGGEVNMTGYCYRTVLRTLMAEDYSTDMLLTSVDSPPPAAAFIHIINVLVYVVIDANRHRGT